MKVYMVITEGKVEHQHFFSAGDLVVLSHNDGEHNCFIRPEEDGGPSLSQFLDKDDVELLGDL